MTKKTEEIQRLKPSQLEPSEWNRNDLGAKNGELIELTSSIKEHGVLMPLIVRADRTKAGRYEIVCGHRRHAAALKLKMEDVPCLVKVLEDDEAITYQIIENLQRKNLGPIEEAKAFKQLAETAGCDAAGVAKMVDKSEKYVSRAIALLELPAAAVKAMEKGLITAAHGHQLLRVGPKQIDTMVKYATTETYGGELPSVMDLQTEIESKAMKDLRSAPFPKDKEYAGKIACTGCQYNTGNQDVLFDGAEDGHCTNGQCFAAKIAQSGKDLEDKAKKKFPDLKFVGVASEQWVHNGGPQQVKGYAVVDEDVAKIKKALKDHPDKFGVGIMKPGRSYGSKYKRPTIVLVTSDLKLAGVKEDDTASHRAPAKNASAEDIAKDRFLTEWMEKAVAKMLGATYPFAPDLLHELIAVTWTQSSWNQGALEHYFEAVGLEVENKMGRKEMVAALQKLGEGQLMRLFVWILIVTNEDDNNLITAIADANEIDLDKVRKSAYASGEQEWATHKDAIMSKITKAAEAIS